MLQLSHNQKQKERMLTQVTTISDLVHPKVVIIVTLIIMQIFEVLTVSNHIKQRETQLSINIVITYLPMTTGNGR